VANLAAICRDNFCPYIVFDGKLYDDLAVTRANTAFRLDGKRPPIREFCHATGYRRICDFNLRRPMGIVAKGRLKSGAVRTGGVVCRRCVCVIGNYDL